jgi:hypothetical protein
MINSRILEERDYKREIAQELEVKHVWEKHAITQATGYDE